MADGDDEWRFSSDIQLCKVTDDGCCITDDLIRCCISAFIPSKALIGAWELQFSVDPVAYACIMSLNLSTSRAFVELNLQGSPVPDLAAILPS